jgi:metal-responsive CopG/Arc/MetJ family transcriptional regulator
MQPSAKRNVITIDIPPHLVEWLDEQAKKLTISRSAVVRMMITRAMDAKG